MNLRKIKIGIIREGKTPPDSRVALTPKQCKQAMENFPIEILVESSPSRCYSDAEYLQEKIPIVQILSDCDVLLGVKEVPTSQLIPHKTYFFFSHTVKQQPYNRKLLWAVLEKNIRLIDYEVLKDEQGNRLIAFGRFAGMVGAHNALWAYGQRTQEFTMPRMKEFHDYEAAKAFYKQVQFPAVKIVLTGTGRVSTGAADVLRDMGIEQVSPTDFLKKKFLNAVFTQLSSQDYVGKKDDGAFSKTDFYAHPARYVSLFQPYYQSADIMINGIYWDSQAPAFFSAEEMGSPDFNIKTIADVTCDIAPVSSIPSTLKASTIAEPLFGFDPKSGLETEPHLPGSVDMMTIDNLPNEMPRDASEAFGNQFLTHILPELCKPHSRIIEGGTIAANGQLTSAFKYLEDYANVVVRGGSLA